MMRWSRLHGDMQGCQFKGRLASVWPIKTWLDKATSEIPCRVIDLPVPAHNGEALFVCGAQGRRDSEWVIPWEVGSSELDPVTTDRSSEREIVVSTQAVNLWP
jgi:hypothetical protein